MLKKLKQKKQLFAILASLIISINLIGFLPFILVSPKTAQAAECQVTASDVTSQKIQVNKYKVNEDEPFEFYTEVNITASKGGECATSGKDGFVFSYYLYKSSSLSGCSSLSDKNYRVTSNATFFNENGKYGFRHKVTNATLKKFYEGSTVGNYGTKNCLYSYFHKKDSNVSTSQFYVTYGEDSPPDTADPNNPDGYIQYETGGHLVTDTTIPAGVPSTAWEQLPLNNNQEAVKADELEVIIKPTSDGKGLRDKYRVSLEGKEDMHFGVTKELDAINAEWGAKKLLYHAYMGVPKDNKSTLDYDFSQQYEYTKLYSADGSKPWDPKSQCIKGTGSSDGGIIGSADDCSKILHVKDAFGAESSNPSGDNKRVLPGTFDPTIKSATWTAVKAKDGVAEGESIGSVAVYIVPVVWSEDGVSYVIGKGNLAKVNLEVYKTDKDIIAACKKDPNVKEEDKSKCDNINFAKYGVGSAVTQSSSSSENADTGAVGDLFNFLRKVISYVVLLMTSIIYWVFSVILVPVLNALLKIKPYQDQFVNFIYPGWVIMRNIANIGFIIALLWMGLRTLFQVDDSGKARGFILWLVLMALLVNFSLVIAQGVVGIADTVQSQFLPAESKVIEALGQKLMVDPIKAFRGEGTADSSNNFSVDSSASDLTKPIVLLILAIAAFFSFVALIAFIMVRLVALWILYMVSPIAYVAKILPDTKKYWDQWWGEFIKYAFTVPILAFFLNITALMATTFAKNSGDTVIAGRDPNYLLGNVAGEFTEYAITVISHFVVLFFLFIGMKFAAGSGTFGAKQIVDGAKKGFDFATKTAPLAAGKWAKDTGADVAAGWKRKDGSNYFSDKAQNRIRAVARPISTGKAAWKGYFTNPREEMEKRFTKTFDKVTDKVQPWGENKLFPAQMALWKLQGQDSTAVMKEADRLKRFTEIRNDDANDEIRDNRTEDEQKLNDLNRGQVDLDTADEVLAKAEQEVAAATAAHNQNPSFENRQKRNDAEDKRDQIKTAVDAARAAGSTTVAETDLGADFDSAPLKASLQASIDDATDKLDKDRELRREVGFTGRMDDETKKDYENQASAKATEAIYKDKPFSQALKDKEDQDAREQQKGLGELDYDQLEAGFNKALKQNNMASARAHFKQMADNGVLDKLLTSKKKPDGTTMYNNNVEGLANFVKDNLKGAGMKSQINIIREASNSSAKNGNVALSNAVKSLPNGGGILNNINQQQQILVKQKVKNVTEMKTGDITYTDNNGNEQFNAGVEEKLKSYNNEEKAKVLKRDLDRKVADHILKKYESAPAEIKKLGDHVAGALVDVASPKMANKFKPHL